MRHSAATSSSPDRRTLFLYLVAAIAIHAITAWNSVGYFHADEHFQILEFANHKAGDVHTPAEVLPWEFEAQIRSGTQVVMAWAIMKGCRAVGVSDPFMIAMVLRYLSAAFSLFTLALLYRAFRPWLINSTAHHVFLFCSVFLWFIPFLGVRFSSETWSACSFFTGAAWLILRPPPASKFSRLCIGVLFGMAFNFRYQAGILVAATVLWLLLNRRERTDTGTFFLIAGILAALGLGGLADRWLYEEWTLSAWNYLRTAFFEGRGADYGTAPWHYYFGKLLERATPLLGALILVAVLFFWWKHRRHFLAWATFFFVLVHMAIPHKEFRFMFPLIFLVPIAIATLWQQQNWPPSVVRSMVAILLIFNLPLLLHKMISPASPRVKALEVLHQQQGSRAILLYTDYSPYDAGGLVHTFYRPLEPFHMQKATTDEIAGYVEEKAVHFTTEKDLVRIPGTRAELVYKTYPEWITAHFNFGNWVERTSMESIYRLEKEQ